MLLAQLTVGLKMAVSLKKKKWMQMVMAMEMKKVIGKMVS